MTWDDKVKMCTHLNKGEYDEAVNMVVPNINDMDNQAIMMFITGFSLSHYELCRPIAKEIGEWINIANSLDFRSQLRLQLLNEKLTNDERDTEEKD